MSPIFKLHLAGLRRCSLHDNGKGKSATDVGPSSLETWVELGQLRVPQFENYEIFLLLLALP